MSTNRIFKRRGRSSGAAECHPQQSAAIEQYVAKHVGPVTSVLHEIRSEVVHVDIHVVQPSTARPYWFLFTTGMSALPMRVPAGMGLVPHAELSLALPASWPMDRERWKREPKWWWPIRELQSLARMPHQRRTWVGAGHTIENGPPLRRYEPSMKFVAMMLVPSTIGDPEGSFIETHVKTELLSLVPLHADELAYKLAHGACALADHLDKAGVTEWIDPDRPSALRARFGGPARPRGSAAD